MPAFPRKTVLCRYRYDPLDRLADCVPYEEAGIQRFYCKTRLATEIQDAVHRSVFQHDDQLLAQQQSQSGKLDTTLLATDQQRSVLNALDATQPHPLAYTPYGHRPPENGLLSLLGFNGERPDPVTGNYLLGNGYRAFNPVLMRFNSPDSWSPFGEGGLNAYGYCGGDPRNRVDPTGHSFLNFLSLIRPSNSLVRAPTVSQKTFDTASRIANMEQGMLYKGQTLGYQLGEKSSKLKLDGKSVEKIESYTRIIKEVNGKLIDETTSLLNAITDPLAKQRATENIYGVIQYPTVVAPSTRKDFAVAALHSEAMYFSNHKGNIEYLQKLVKTTTPEIRSSHIRQLT